MQMTPRQFNALQHWLEYCKPATWAGYVRPARQEPVYKYDAQGNRVYQPKAKP